MHLTGSKIAGISVYLPERILSNNDLEVEFPDFKAEKVEKKVGIKNRHIAAPDETAVDMAEQALLMLFERYPESRSCDFLLLCTQSPDYILPTSACLLQNRLGLSTKIGALDFNLGCSGYVYGLALAKGLISGGIARKVILVTAETYSKRLNCKDKGNRSLFGDAAAATLICASESECIGNFALGTNGAGAENLIIRNGGARYPFDPGAGLKNGTCTDNDILMNGPEIFNFTIDVVPGLVNSVLELNHLNKDELDLIIFHQANRFMLDFLRDQLNFSREKFFLSLENTGNTVSATIPIAIHAALESGRAKAGDKILLVGFGVGYSYGAVTITI